MGRITIPQVLKALIAANENISDVQISNNEYYRLSHEDGPLYCCPLVLLLIEEGCAADDLFYADKVESNCVKMLEVTSDYIRGFIDGVDMSKNLARVGDDTIDDDQDYTLGWLDGRAIASYFDLDNKRPPKQTEAIKWTRKHLPEQKYEVISSKSITRFDV